MGLQPFLILKTLTLTTWSSLLMHQAPFYVMLTFNVFWFHYYLATTSKTISYSLWQELLAILASALTWGHQWQRKYINPSSVTWGSVLLLQILIIGGSTLYGGACTSLGNLWSLIVIIIWTNNSFMIPTTLDAHMFVFAVRE